MIVTLKKARVFGACAGKEEAGHAIKICLAMRCELRETNAELQFRISREQADPDVPDNLEIDDRIGQTTPIVYEQDGRQFVVIAPGGHHFMETPVSDAVIAYALPAGG